MGRNNHPGGLLARRDGRQGWRAMIVTPNAVKRTSSHYPTLGQALAALAAPYEKEITP